MAADREEHNKPALSGLKTKPFERNLALTRLGLGAGSKIVAHSIANLFRGEVSRDEADRSFYRRQAEELAAELGRLKGSVMKAGQMLSLWGQYFLPPEAVEVLASLQDDTPPVEWGVVAPVLEAQLGRDRLAELDIDTRPLAAASLGQAHRARRRRDGLELCIKIQYPGVADAIDSDIRTLSRLLVMTRLTPKGLDLQPIFTELREMLLREVDYRAERAFTEDFGRRLASDRRYRVPEVLPDYCGSRVLTTSFETGLHVRHAGVQGLSQARRNALGEAFVELFLEEFFVWGQVQTDPHFGNYRIRPDEAEGDRIVLLDFGATRRFEPGFVQRYSRIVRGALEGDRALVARGAREIGLMKPEVPAAVNEAFAAMCEVVVEPFREDGDPRVPAALWSPAGGYRWGASDLPMRAAQMAARNALSVHFQMPPREIVFLHRRLAGVFIMLAALGAEVRTGEALRRVLARIPEQP